MKKKPLPAAAHKYAAKLSDEQKAFVVTRLATYATPSAIALDLQAQFGVSITAQSVMHYHPEMNSGDRLAQRWRDLFRETRRLYVERSAEIGTADKMVRMRWRENMALKAEEAGDYRIANALLDSIAKEAGDAFEKTRQQGRFGMRKNAAPATIYINGKRFCGPGPDEPEAADGDREPRG